MTKPTALITGVGPGTGSALVRRFVRGGYAVAMIARSAERLAALEKELPSTRGFVCDVTDEEQIDTAVNAARAEFGDANVFIHNAVGGAFGNFLEIEPKWLNRNFQINTMALLHFARRLAPPMIAAGHGAIIATGNTSAYRGKPDFAGFAPSKAAQRILAESIARELGPKGIHVAYITIDAVIDLEWTRKRRSLDTPDSFYIQPTAIAEEVFHTVSQDRSAWSFNVELRPFAEKW